MLRIKRSVQAKLNSDVAYISSQIANSKIDAIVNPMHALEKEFDNELDVALVKRIARQNTKISGFVRAEVSEKPQLEREKELKANPDKIDIDEEFEGENDTDNQLKGEESNEERMDTQE